MENPNRTSRERPKRKRRRVGALVPRRSARPGAAGPSGRTQALARDYLRVVTTEPAALHAVVAQGPGVIPDVDTLIKEEVPIAMKMEDGIDDLIVKGELDIGPTVLQKKTTPCPVLAITLSGPGPYPRSRKKGGSAPVMVFVGSGGAMDGTSNVGAQPPRRSPPRERPVKRPRVNPLKKGASSLPSALHVQVLVDTSPVATPDPRARGGLKEPHRQSGIDEKEVTATAGRADTEDGLREDLAIVDVLPSDSTQQDADTKMKSSFATPVAPFPHNQVISADVPYSGREKRVTQNGIAGSSSEVSWGGGDADSDSDDEVDSERRFFTARRGLPSDEDLPAEVASSIRNLETLMDAEHKRLLSGDGRFEWQEDFTTFNGAEHFSVSPTGPVKSYSSPYEAFVDLFDESIMLKIVMETNSYARKLIEEAKSDGTFTKDKRMHRWKDTNVDELYCLFAIFISMGLCHRTSLVEYWKRDWGLAMFGFGKLMSFDRYVLLTRCLCFVNNEKQPNEGVCSMSSPPHELRSIIFHLNDKFRTLYVLDKYINIQQSRTLSKAYLPFAYCLKTKAARQVRSYELCDSQTGYLYKFIFHSCKEILGGRSDNEEDKTNSPYMRNAIGTLAAKFTQTVLRLLDGLENKGHRVVMDNFFNSPTLARYLKSRGFDCLGAVRLSRRNVPEDLKKVTLVSKKGAVVARHSGDVALLSWRDEDRVVSVVNTCHDDATMIRRQHGAVCVKPVCVHDYDSTVTRVELRDRRLSAYLTERKGRVKRSLRMFKRLLNVCVHNAFVLFRREQTVTLADDVAKKCSITLQREFRYQLVDELAMRHRSAVPSPDPGINRYLDLESVRLDRTKHHLPIPGSRRKCHMCAMVKGRGQSAISCSACGVALCVMQRDCFRDYHTLGRIPMLRRKRQRPRRTANQTPSACDV